MGERCGDKLEVNLVEATGKIKGRPSEANHSVSLFLSSMHGCPKIMANLYILFPLGTSRSYRPILLCTVMTWCQHQQQRTVPWCQHRECLSGQKAAHLTQLASVFYFCIQRSCKIPGDLYEFIKQDRNVPHPPSNAQKMPKYTYCLPLRPVVPLRSTRLLPNDSS